MKNNNNSSSIIGVLTKINSYKINQNKLYTKKSSNSSITARPPNTVQNTTNSKSNKKIKINIINNNEERSNNMNNSQKKINLRVNKTKEKIINNSGIKKNNSNKKILTVNKSYNINFKNKNKKNETKDYNSLNSGFSTQNENKDSIQTSTKANINCGFDSSKRVRNKSRDILNRKIIGNIQSFMDEDKSLKINKNGTTTSTATTGKKTIKKFKSNNNIKINLNNNFKNTISNNNKNSKTKIEKQENEIHNFSNIINSNIKNDNKIEKKDIKIKVINQKMNKTNLNFNKKINNKIPNNKDILIEKNKKQIKYNRNDILDIKNKNSNSSNKKLLTKTLTKKHFENENNKSICTINNSKSKINVGRPSTNEMIYNSINTNIDTKSIQILSPLKSKHIQNINKKKNSINLLGSYNVKKTNTITFKNNNIVRANNLKKKNIKMNNDNKNNIIINKKSKILNNNNETNNTTGTIGTIFINKEEHNLSKILDIKNNKNKSSKYLKINQTSNIIDSIESKNIDSLSNCNSTKNKKIIKKNNKKNKQRKNIKIKNKIHIIENNKYEDDNKNNSPKINQFVSESPNSPKIPTSEKKKNEGMNKKTKSVSYLQKIKKVEVEPIGELKKCPLSKKSLKRPKLNDKIIIKFEDLITFETKLNDIIEALVNKDNINEGGASNECAEFIVFYFHSSLFGIFINFFSPNNKIIIHSGNNLLLLTIIITYHLSINPKMLENLLDDMKYVFSLLKINFLLFIKKIEIYYEDEFPMKYADLLNQKLGQIKITNCSNEIDIISKINKNCCNISERIKLILNYYQRNNDKYYNEFNGIFKNISTVSEKNINNYFYSYLYINPFTLESNKINNINNINSNYNNGRDSSKNFSRICSSISSSSNTSSLKGFDDNDSDNFYNDNFSYKTEKSEDIEREISSVKSYKSINYCGKLNSNSNIGSIINCDNNFYYNIENNIYENDEDGTNAVEIMKMLKEYEMNKVEAPFIIFPPKKKYTLVLDLDETLIHLRQKKDVINIKNDVNIKINNTSDNFYNINDKDKNKYLLQFRVGLFSFLTILKPFYEIISFTSATREYADVIINEIEKNRTFFDHKFYREHTVIYKDTFVKDISRIGRDIKRIIIIDNNERNFILNKENGIKIAPYYGDEDNINNSNNSINSENNGRLSYGKKRSDNVLLELKKILVMIYKDNYDDLREALKDYEDLIKVKVTKNLK